MESLHPLSYWFILWGGGVGHLELEQVVASWSVTVLVEHNRGASAACIEQRGGGRRREKMQVKDSGTQTGYRRRCERLQHIFQQRG